METNLLYLHKQDAMRDVQKLANEKGVVYGEISDWFIPRDITPQGEEDVRMLLNILIYERKIWRFNAFELVTDNITYHFIYLV